MFERFTDRARKIMAIANQEAQRFNNQYIGSEHILLGLLKEGGGVGANVLKDLDIDLRKLWLEVEKQIKRESGTPPSGKLPQTPRSKKVIEFAIEEARGLGHKYVGSEHILLGLIREQEGLAAQSLQAAGINLEIARSQILRSLSPDSPPSQLTGPLASTIKELLTTHDQTLREISEEVSECATRGETDKIAALKARYEHIAAARMQELLDCIGRDGFFSRALSDAISSTPPDRPITPACLLMAIIKSNPALAAALAPLLPEIAKALKPE